MSNWAYVVIGIVGGVLLLPLTVWAGSKILVWYLKRKLGGLEGGATDVPLRVTLRKAGDLEWLDDETAQAQVKDLLELGFQPSGQFSVAELGEVSMATYVEPTSGTAAYLCKHPALTLSFLDLVHVYEDGSSLAVSNAKDQGTDPCPAHPNIKHEGATPKELFTVLQDRSKGKSPIRLVPDKVKETFEQGYAAVMDWRVEKGGVSDQEIRANSPGEMTEEEWEAARETFHQQHLYDVDELLRIRFAEQSQVSIPEWEQVRDNLVFVHDRMRPQDVHSLLCEDIFTRLEEDVPHPGKPGREGFQELLGKLDQSSSLKMLGVVTGTIEADVYLRPEDPDDC